MIEISVKEFAAIKRIAMNVATSVTTKQRILAKIHALQDELAAVQALIDAQQGPVKAMTGGFTTEDLILRGEDRKYTFNPARVRFCEEKRVYIAIREDESFDSLMGTAEQPAEEPSDEATTQGSDLDIDEQEIVEPPLPDPIEEDPSDDAEPSQEEAAEAPKEAFDPFDLQ